MKDAIDEQINQHAKKIWGRARANAFSHRAAAEAYECKSKILFFIQLVLSLSSLFLIILLYALISGDGINPNGYTTLVVTLASVAYSMIGMGVGVMQNYMGFEQKFITHSHCQHSYLYMAQRAKEVESPCMGEEEKIELLKDLEKDFQILKVRGQEPSDRDFRIGHLVMEGVSESSFSGLQSYKFKEPESDAANDEHTSLSNSESSDKIMMKTKKNKVGYVERHICLFIFLIFTVLFGTSVIGLTYFLPRLISVDSLPKQAIIKATFSGGHNAKITTTLVQQNWSLPPPTTK